MKKTIKTSEERAQDAIASGKFVGFPHDHMPAEIAELRAYIAELESRPAVTDLPQEFDADLWAAVAQGWCAPENAHKTMDSDLATAIVRNVQKAIDSRAPAAPVVAGGLTQRFYLHDGEMRPSHQGEWVKISDIHRAMRTAHPVAGSPARDWPEDFKHENGNYENRCSSCGSMFIGHKGRITCKRCTTAAEPMPASEAPGQKREAHADAEYLGRKAKFFRAATAAPVPASEAASVKWLPTAENVNALPDGVRHFVHDLVARCDPAGDVAALTGLRDQLDGVQIMYRKAADALEEVRGCFEAAEVEGLADALAATSDDRLKDLIERRLMHAYRAATSDSNTNLAAPTAPTDTNQERADFENWYLTHTEGAELGSHDCAKLWSAWLARSGGFYKAPRDWQIAPMPWSAPAAPTDAKPDDLDAILALGRDDPAVHAFLTLKRRDNLAWVDVLAKMVLHLAGDKASLADRLLTIASVSPSAAQSVRDAAQPTAAPGKEA